MLPDRVSNPEMKINVNISIHVKADHHDPILLHVTWGCRGMHWYDVYAS